MTEVEISDDIIQLIDEARRETLTNARNQVSTAIDLFTADAYQISCFVAMTAIEEAGKVGLLQFVRGNQLMGTPSKVNTKELRSILSDHQGKALRSAASAICVNERARRIYGTHPDCDLYLKDGLLLLARAGNEWMRIRGNCMYTDLGLHAKSLSVPSQSIDSNYAYYFICMAGEVVAEEAERGFGSWIEGRDPSRSIEFWNQTKEEVDDFVDEYGSDFEPSELEFFTDPRFSEIRESIAERLDLSEDEREFGIEMSVEHFKLAAQAKGKSAEEIEKEATDLQRTLEESQPEMLPSAECVKEFRRLAKDVNTVVVADDGDS